MKINPHNLRLSRPVPDSPARRRHANNYYVMGRGASDAGNWAVARDYLDKALEYYSELQPALREMAFVYMNLNDYRQAIKYIKRAIDADPKDAAAHFLHGNILFNSGDANGALAAYKNAHEEGEITLELLNNIGLAHLMNNDGVAASMAFTELTARFPTNPNGWDGLGCAQRIAQDYPGSIKSFYRALEIDPVMNEAREHLAQTFIETGNPHDAVIILLEALRLKAENEGARSLLGLAFVALCRSKNVDASWKILQDSGNNTPEISYQLAETHLKLGQKETAMAILENIVTSFPRFSIGHLQLGIQLLQEGEHERGWQHIDSAHQLTPHDTMVNRMAKMAYELIPNGAPDWAKDLR